MLEELKNLVKISHYAGERQDYIQGGGGNTSAKLCNGIMAIKASGTLLKDMTENYGFAAISSDSVLEYHRTTPKGEDRDYNKEVGSVASDSIVIVNGEGKMRPSVEAGFHSALLRYVIHSHSVYANVFTCYEGGTADAVAALSKHGIKAAVIPAVNPGYFLTEKILEIREIDPKINVFLMENHGIIATDDDADVCIALHEAANMALKTEFGLSDFADCNVKPDGEKFSSATPWLVEKLDAERLRNAIFDVPLYPDQLVYITKEKIDSSTAVLKYGTSALEAQVICETVCGVVYVLSEIERLEKTVKTMTPEGVAYILGWDSEKYRKENLKR